MSLNPPARSGAAPRRIEYMAFYFFEFMGIGITAPFLIIYLEKIRFSGLLMGATMAGQRVVGILGHGLWGAVSDTRLGLRKTILLLVAMSGLLMPVFCFITPHWLIFVMVLAVTFFNGSLIPLSDAGIMTHLDEHADLYGTVRAFGAVGFIVAAGLVGKLIATHSIFWLFWSFSAIMAAMFLVGLATPFTRRPGGRGRRLLDAYRGIDWRRMAPVMVVIFLMNLAARPGGVFLSLLITTLGGDESYVGLAWAIGPILEIPFFFFSHHLIRRFGLKSILMAGLGLFVVRWILIALAPSPGFVLLIQPLHGVCFGTTFIAAVRAADQMSGAGSRSSGQAVHQSLGVSAPTIVGQFAAGWAYDALGVRAIYWCAAVVSLAALVLAWFWVDFSDHAEKSVE